MDIKIMLFVALNLTNHLDSCVLRDRYTALVEKNILQSDKRHAKSVGYVTDVNEYNPRGGD